MDWGACGLAPASIRDTQYFINQRKASVDEAAALVDELWARLPRSMANMGVKDGAYFRWYTQAGRTNGRMGLVITDASGEPTAMAIILDMGKGVAWLADMWCDFGDTEVLKSLVAIARKHVSQLGFHCFWVPHYQPALAASCRRCRSHDLPISAFFKMPGTSPWDEPS